MRGRREGQRVGPYWLPDADKRGWPYAARKEARLTIAELATLANVSRRTIIRAEKSQWRNAPSSYYRRNDPLARVARVLAERAEAAAKGDSRIPENGDSHEVKVTIRARPKKGDSRSSRSHLLRSTKVTRRRRRAKKK